MIVAKILVGALVVGGVLASADAARADVNCGTAPGAWNVPRGGLTVNRSANGGPVGAVIDSINEHWTHSSVSHGVDASGVSWGTMDTMTEPGKQGWPSVCGTPLDTNQLGNGQPGSRTDNAGGLWEYYYGNGGQVDFQYVVAPHNARGSYYADVEAQCMTDWYKTSTAGCGADCTNGRGYSVYSYMSFSLGGGTMCSGNIAFMYWNARNAAGSYCTPDGMTTHTYPNSTIYGAAVNLWYSVYNQCNAQQSGFYGFLSGLACFWTDPCTNAANQVVNCFSNDQGGNCGRTDTDWYQKSPVLGGRAATTISPARVKGDYGHADSNSPYNGGVAQPVQFNQPGAVYGCWHQ